MTATACNGPADSRTPGGVYGCTVHGLHFPDRGHPCGLVYFTADTDHNDTGLVNPDGTPHHCNFPADRNIKTGESP